MERARITDFSIDAIMGTRIGAQPPNSKPDAFDLNRVPIDSPEEIIDVINDVDEDQLVVEPSSSQSSGSKIRRTRPKKYQCPNCPVTLYNTAQYRGHLRIHTGERPFRCDRPTCNKTFTRNEELTRHKRIHSGLRPYECDSCGKRFGRKDHLKKHLKTHEKQAQRLQNEHRFTSQDENFYTYNYLHSLSQGHLELLRKLGGLPG